MTEWDEREDTPSDVLDKASQVEQRNMNISRQEHAKKMKRSQEPGPDGFYPVLDCIECGNEIGEGRLRVSIKNTLCIACANHAEGRR